MTRSRASGSSSRNDDGVGIISTTVGFLVATVLLLFAVQLSLDLWSRSVLSAVAYDAARVVAGSDSGATPEALATAESQARSELGRAATDVSFRWAVTTEFVALTVDMHRSTLLPEALMSPLGLDHVSRTAEVSRERVR